MSMAEDLQWFIEQVRDHGFPPDTLADVLFRDYLGPDNLDDYLAMVPEAARAQIIDRLRDPDFDARSVFYGGVEWRFPERAKQAAAIIKARYGAWTEEEIAEKERQAAAALERGRARVAARQAGAAAQHASRPPTDPETGDR
jgi:hypothetical protein